MIQLNSVPFQNKCAWFDEFRSTLMYGLIYALLLFLALSCCEHEVSRVQKENFPR